jgi:hypothetical protein
MKFIILIALLISQVLIGDELLDRKQITSEVKELFLTSQYEKLTQLSKDYLVNKRRTASGKWKLDSFYFGIGKTVKNADFSTLEKISLGWIKEYPNSEAAHISYAKILAKKGWYSRGVDSARYTSKSQWKNLKYYMKKARIYLNKHKKNIANDPGWYVLMLDICRGENWDKKRFFALLDEAIDQHPYFNAIYYAALYNMQPNWGSFSKEEVEEVAQKALLATKEKGKNSRYARFYWVASQLIYRNDLFSKSDVNWTIMSQGIDDILEEFPTQWNINYFAYYSCLARDKEKTKYLLDRIKDKPNKYPWINNQNIYEKCLQWANSTDKNTTNINYVKEIKLDALEDYITNNTMDKPTYIHFSTYKKGCLSCDIKMLDEVAGIYHNKINFVSINMLHSTMKEKSDLYRKYLMKRDPFSMIVHKQKITMRRDNVLYFISQQVARNRQHMVKNVIKDYLSEVKYSDYFDQFKTVISDNASFFNSEENIRTDMSAYSQHKKEYKATAAAASFYQNKWAYSRAFSKKSEEEAKKKALIGCEKNRKKFKVIEKCKLHMIGDIYVYEKSENEIKTIVNKQYIPHKNMSKKNQK